MRSKNEGLGHHLPTPAMIVAVLALVVALGGSALAVTAAKKNSVATKSIRNGAVKTKKLADDAVKEAKIASAAVTATKLADGSVIGAKIAPGAVGSAAIGEGAVGNSELTADAVSVGKIEPGALQASRFFQASTYTSNFPSVGAQSCTTDQPSGFEQLRASDRVIVTTPDNTPAPLVIRASAQSGGVVFTLCNISGAPVDPPSLGFGVLVIR